MKTIFLLALALLSSCALLQDFQETEFNWLGDPHFKSSKKAPEAVTETPVAPPVSDLKKRVESSDKKATLVIENQLAKLELRDGKATYKQGHSIEVMLDEVPAVFEVAPTKGAESDEVYLAKPELFIQQLKGRKTLKVEILLNGKSAQKYQFNVSDL